MSTTPAVKRVTRMLQTRYLMSPLTASSCATAVVREIEQANGVADSVERRVASLRADLQRLPEYTHGSLAWRVMNNLDTWIVELRGGAA